MNRCVFTLWKNRLFTFHVHWVCGKICLPSASLNTICINTCQSLYVTAASAAACRRFRYQPACHDGSCRSASSPPSKPFDSRWCDLIIQPFTTTAFIKISANQWIHQHQYLDDSYCVLCIYRLMLMLTDLYVALLLHANTLACIILTECQLQPFQRHLQDIMLTFLQTADTSEVDQIDRCFIHLTGMWCACSCWFCGTNHPVFQVSDGSESRAEDRIYVQDINQTEETEGGLNCTHRKFSQQLCCFIE